MYLKRPTHQNVFKKKEKKGKKEKIKGEKEKKEKIKGEKREKKRK